MMTQPHPPETSKTLRAPIIAGVFIFLATLIASIPASAISLFADKSGGALSYAEARGTIWKGELSSVSVGGIALGDVGFRLAPLSLLRLSPEMTLSANGAVRGSGTVSLGGERASLRNVKADINLATVAVRGLLGEPAQGEARLDIERLDFSLKDGCRQASGSLWTNALDGPTKRYNLPPLPLSGRVACEGDKLAVTLAGENVQMAADLRLLLNPALTYEVTATARASEENIASALRVFGFEDDNGALTYGSAGVLTGAGS
ncbi:type II secretion system protein N [Marinicaulis aureus]|uniref:Type II secretion system protein N n=1 Tax=Hyphococcus aureus TaxID=2666033 RepID=A0ABW1KXC6_9PROT